MCDIFFNLVPEDPPQNLVTGNVTGKSFSISWEPPNIVTGKFTYKVELYGQTGKSVNLILYYCVHMFHNLLCLVIN